VTETPPEQEPEEEPVPEPSEEDLDEITQGMGPGDEEADDGEVG
jgi:hypothetical protein